jgi:DNA-binding transcriptional LysR family regulator
LASYKPDSESSAARWPDHRPRLASARIVERRRVAVLSGLMRSPLPDNFNTLFPALRVEFIMSDKLVDLAKGQADIAIRAVAPTDNALIGRKIAESPWAVYASRSYVDRHGSPKRKEDIDQHIVVRSDGEMTDHAAARWLHSVAPNARVAAHATSLPTMLLAVKSGIGLAPLPLIVGENESDLVRLLGPLPGLNTRFYLLMHQNMKRTPRVRAFFDFIVDEIKEVRAILEGSPLKVQAPR